MVVDKLVQLRPMRVELNCVYKMLSKVVDKLFIVLAVVLAKLLLLVSLSFPSLLGLDQDKVPPSRS